MNDGNTKFSAWIDLGNTANVETAIKIYQMLKAPFDLSAAILEENTIYLEHEKGLMDPGVLRFFLQALLKMIPLSNIFSITDVDVRYNKFDKRYINTPVNIPENESLHSAVDIDMLIDILVSRTPETQDIIKVYHFKSYPIVDGIKQRISDQIKYVMNSGMYWNFEDAIPDNTPVWVLAEEDTCDPTQIPSIFRIIHDSKAGHGMKPRLLDFDPESQEEHLSGNNWEIIAWRFMTEHDGTFDKYYKEHNVTELSNWTITLDKEKEDGDS